MCGRYYIDYEVDLVFDEIYESLLADGPKPSGLVEIYPDTKNAVLVAAADSMQAVWQKWGVRHGNAFLINARSESIHERVAFRDAFHATRCIVPASGFYEWTGKRKEKQKYKITTRETGPIYMAGLFIPGAIDRYVIITTESTGDMRFVHHRSPVLLSQNESIDYLHDDAHADALIQRPNGSLLITRDESDGHVQLSFLDLLP